MAEKQKYREGHRKLTTAARGGFILIELCIGLTVMGFVMVGVMQIYKVYRAQKYVTLSKERVETVREAIKDFAGKYGRLPCVADPALPPNNAEYGREILRTSALTDPVPVTGCATNTGTAGAATRVTGARTFPAPGTCGNAAVDANENCVNCAADVGVCTPNVPHTHARIGAIPVRTLGLPDAYMADASENLYVYAVSEYLTIATGGSPSMDFGVIEILQDNNIDSAISPPGSALYVIVGPGRDGVGARSRWGGAPAPCAGPPKDVENCDGDATFIAASYSEQ